MSEILQKGVGDYCRRENQASKEAETFTGGEDESNPLLEYDNL
jgi:hypothetical protein